MLAHPDRAPPEIEPGVTVADLTTMEACDRALDQLTMAIALIERQLKGTSRTSSNMPLGWRANAEAALRIKKFLMPRVQERRGEVKREAKQAQHVGTVVAARALASEKRTILCRIVREIAPDVMGRALTIAEERHPDLFGPGDPS